MSAATTGEGYSSRKFITEELLVKLNTLLEQISRQQPPINPSVDAYKRENEKVKHYLNELKKNPDDPYLRAQLHQAMDDKQHLYDLIQGNKNPFKTDTTSTTSTQTQPEKKSASTQSDVLSDIEKLKEMFRTEPPKTERTRHQSGPDSFHYREKPKPRRSRIPIRESYWKTPPTPPLSPPPSYHTQTPKKPRPKGFPGVPRKTPKRPTMEYYKPPRRLVTNVKDWS